MSRPKMYRREMNNWGIYVSIRCFLTQSQLHSAFASYAKSLQPEKTFAEVDIQFDDGSTDTLEFDRATKTLEYKDYDGEVWEVDYDSKKWQHPLMDDTSSSLRVMARKYAGDDKIKILEIREYN